MKQKKENLISEEQVNFILTEMCEYYSPEEIKKHIPQITLTITSIYERYRKLRLNTFIQARKKRKIHFENLYEENEKDLRAESLSRAWESLADAE